MPKSEPDLAPRPAKARAPLSLTSDAASCIAKQKDKIRLLKKLKIMALDYAKSL